jgi:hypothetical protein
VIIQCSGPEQQSGEHILFVGTVVVVVRVGMEIEVGVCGLQRALWPSEPSGLPYISMSGKGSGHLFPSPW